MAPKRAEKATAYYARVSLKTQDMRSQIPDLEAHAGAQGGPVRWYKDTFTGTDMERPGSAQLMKDLRAGLIGQIVIWRLDRLGRTTAGLVNLLDALRDLKVAHFPARRFPRSYDTHGSAHLHDLVLGGRVRD